MYVYGLFRHGVEFPSLLFSRVGNFIIGASVSDKQMLCGSFVACAAQTISAVNKIQKG